MEHIPVLADNVVELLAPAAGDGWIVDATLGRGGHAARLLDAAPSARLVGIDHDPVALEESRTNLGPRADRVRFVRGDFKDLASLLERLGIEKVRGVLLDLGVSSPQLDEAHRGFSYRIEGPLDMRMDPSQRISAADVVNTYAPRDLERTIATFGEERFARRIARAIVANRPIETTTELAEVVKEAVPAATRRTGPHPARRTFQALRMEVNAELDALRAVLPEAVDALEPGGRMAVISYHSLEDRAVKTHFRNEADGCTCPPDFPVCTCGAQARVRVLTRRPIRPREEEIEANPRARAAKLRAVEKLAPPATSPAEGPA
ncbi:MAG: 16S rRNA (cytosine(1402)-N(4))-methyltransferase RsmH [Actinomycetota bacterium]|nr:16S rRNA (cytosine(1402)-N(4))-methyltransferase RsmH [Actinomycetota bacterium]